MRARHGKQTCFFFWPNQEIGLYLSAELSEQGKNCISICEKYQSKFWSDVNSLWESFFVLIQWYWHLP